MERVRSSTLEFAHQAEILVAMMDQRGVGETLIQEAEGLAIFFQSAQYRLEFMFKAALG